MVLAVAPDRWSPASDNHCPYSIVGVGPVEGVDQLIPHHLSERVELVRAAKGDRRYAIGDKVVNLRIRSNRICHRLPPTAAWQAGESRRGLAHSRGSGTGRAGGGSPALG